MANNIEMYHYGVKGMHWGIRRKKSQNHPDEKEKKKKRAFLLICMALWPWLRRLKSLR